MIYVFFLKNAEIDWKFANEAVMCYNISIRIYK